MTTLTPIATFEDILAAMERNPQLQAAMRQHVLDQEFLQLPAIVRELQQTIARLAELIHNYIAATDERLDLIEQRLARLDAGQASLVENVTRLDGNMNLLIGSNYERKAARRASRLAQRQLSLINLRVIYAITTPDNDELPNILDTAVAAGRIDAQEADELENVDLILAGPGQYLVAETSVT